MTDNESKREATFEEEYEILQKEKEELFAMENCDSEPPFANCVVRRASRCIRKLLEEIQQYRAMEEKLNGISVEQVVNGFINTVEDRTEEPYERGRILTNIEADMWNEYRAIGTIEEFKAFRSGDFTEDLLNMGYTKGYNKAIDEFAEKVKFYAKNKWIFDFCEDKDIYDFEESVDEIAEQMKGGKNE